MADHKAIIIGGGIMGVGLLYHLTEQGWPLAGDGTYKRRGRRPPARLAPFLDDSGQRPLLHAWELRLTHPRSGAPLAFRAAPPGDFTQALEALGIDPGRFGLAL